MEKEARQIDTPTTVSKYDVFSNTIEITLDDMLTDENDLEHGILLNNMWMHHLPVIPTKCIQKRMLDLLLKDNPPLPSQKAAEVYDALIAMLRRYPPTDNTPVWRPTYQLADDWNWFEKIILFISKSEDLKESHKLNNHLLVLSYLVEIFDIEIAKSVKGSESMLFSLFQFAPVQERYARRIVMDQIPICLKHKTPFIRSELFFEIP